MFIVQTHEAKYHVNITLDIDKLDIISVESKETGGHKVEKELGGPDGTIYCFLPSSFNKKSMIPTLSCFFSENALLGILFGFCYIEFIEDASNE